jgi:hypothetical protein
MTTEAEISPGEVADRLAIRELVDAYAHCADSREIERQKALFTQETRFAVHMDGAGSPPAQVLEGREALSPVLEDLRTYRATMHFNGQSTLTLDGDRATGESYCMAHHLSVGADGRRDLMVAAIRYLNTFTKVDQCWYFGERVLVVEWSETRSLNGAAV